MKLIISIHTPLAGSDLNAFRDCSRHCNFNPHSPCGERPQKWDIFDQIMIQAKPHLGWYTYYISSPPPQIRPNAKIKLYLTTLFDYQTTIRNYIRVPVLISSAQKRCEPTCNSWLLQGRTACRLEVIPSWLHQREHDVERLSVQCAVNSSFPNCNISNYPFWHR